MKYLGSAAVAGAADVVVADVDEDVAVGMASALLAGSGPCHRPG